MQDQRTYDRCSTAAAEQLLQQLVQLPLAPQFEQDGQIKIAEGGLGLGRPGSGFAGYGDLLATTGGAERGAQVGDLLRRQAAQIGHHPMGGHAVVTAIALDELGVFVAFAVAANTGDAQMHSSYLHLHTINVHIKQSLITVVSTEHLQPCEHKQLSHNPDQNEVAATVTVEATTIALWPCDTSSSLSEHRASSG